MLQIIPNLSVDCVIFGFDSCKLKVLLRERKWIDENRKVIINDHTLTGHHVLKGERPGNAAKRVLKMVNGIVLTLITTFYAVMVGMTSIVWIDVLQYTVMTIASVIIAVIAMNAIAGHMLLVSKNWYSIWFGWRLHLDWGNIIPVQNQEKP